MATALSFRPWRPAPFCVAPIFRFPPDAADVEVEVTKTITRHGETWLRRFGRHAFRSHLSVDDGGLRERFGPFSFAIGLAVRDGELHYPVTGGRIGPISLPKWMLPVSVAREFVSGGAFRFDVALLAPLAKAPMVRYRGFLVAAAGDDPGSPPRDMA